MKRKTIAIAMSCLLMLTQSVSVCAATTSTEGNVDSQVTSTKASTWVVSVPDITLDAATGQGTGTVSMTADLGSTLALQVIPNPTIVMT